MSKSIAEVFARGKAFIPFVTCGDPDLERTEALVRALVVGGADMVELGIPFSDPTAEGPVIAAATARALAAGTTTDRVFAMLERLGDLDVPLAFMTYANVVFSYGAERFISRAAALGIRALILPDVPYEERGEFESVCDAHGVALIRFIAPTSDERIPMICEGAKGFLYVVSSLGVTGVRDGVPQELASLLARIRAVSNVPAAVGFGISTPEQAKAIGSIADGVIIGSAVVKLAHERGAEAPEALQAYAESIKVALETI